MTTEVFPPVVAWEIRHSLCSEVEASPYAGEETHLHRATHTRKLEFLTGRWCARRALARLGAAGVSIPQAEDRSPIWPTGVVGSITHCEGLIGAAVARTDDLAGLGFDAECRRELPGEEVESILSPEEHTAGGRAGPAGWPIVVFSAKEAIYKAVHPLVRVPFDFPDVTLEVDWARGTFIAHATATAPACVHEPVARILGRLRLTADHVVTAAWLPADRR